MMRRAFNTELFCKQHKKLKFTTRNYRSKLESSKYDKFPMTCWELLFTVLATAGMLMHL